MYYLKTTAAFDSAHFLKDYNGKCANLHGHRWQIEAEIAGDSLQAAGEKRGMLLDFGDCKREVRALADSFDHALIIEKDSLRPATLAALQVEGFRVIEIPCRPTAENFAKLFFDSLKNTLPVSRVTVYETPDNCASYTEDAPCS